MHYFKYFNNMTEYYIPWLSCFDNHPYYPGQDIKKLLADHLPYDDIWNEQALGWDNQPEVVCFRASLTDLEIIKRDLETTINKLIQIWTKDW